MDVELFKAIASIVVIDLVLSGDNALVIGMAAGRLRGGARRQAILLGAAGAVGLRVAFTAAVAFLLGVPLLQLGGGLLLLWIAVKLLRPPTHHEGTVVVGVTRWEAIRTIVVADVVMSLDNILAVGGAAHGDLRLLVFGLALSIPLITLGSGLVAAVLDRLPWLIVGGSAVLAWTGGEMIFEDPVAHGVLAALGDVAEWLPAALALAIVTLGLVLRRRVSAASAGRVDRRVGALPPSGYP